MSSGTCSECKTAGALYAKGQCRRCWHRAYEQGRRERLRENYRAADRTRNTTARRREWSRAYRARRRAYFAEKQREYRARHPDIVNARWDKWYAENPDRVALKRRINDQRRLAREHSVISTLTGEQWLAILAAHDYRCVYCGSQPKVLCQDHVIPLAKGGPYTAENIVPACRSCNSKKGDRLTAAPPAPARLDRSASVARPSAR